MPAAKEELPRLGRYQVLNKLATGGMAEVFLAKATGAMGFQRLVAIKLIHPNFTRDQEFVKMFIDEARIAMHLHHRNIVQVFDLDTADDTYFIAMEFVHGVNLYDVYERLAAKNRWIEPTMALYLIAEISKGLHFAHTRRGPDGRPLGIIHRDISPQNVLLSFEGEVKITDFGIATAAERLHQTAAGIVKGKYAYMAPERLQELPTDARVDVFSSGVLLYELLAGENPYAGPSAVDTIENVLNKVVLAPSARGAPVSPGLDRIALKALAKKPAERYSSAQDLADAVTEYAMELTQSRKDMATGDASLAQLLHELFPERAHPPATGAAERRAPSTPGRPRVSVATLDSESATPAASSRDELLRTQEEAPASITPVVDPADEGSSHDATIMRLTPPPQLEDDGQITGEFDGPEDMAATAKGQIDPSLLTPLTPTAHDLDRTAPTELPPFAPPPAGKRPPVTPPVKKAPVTDPLAVTLPSSSNVNTVANESIEELLPRTARALKAQPRANSSSAAYSPLAKVPARDPAASLRPSDSGPPMVFPVVAPAVASINIPVAAPPRSSNLVPALLGIIAVLVVGLGALIITSKTVRAIPVSLRVTSSPPGARVYLDGAQQAGLTPFHTAVLTGEEHELRVQLEGHPPAPPQKVMATNPSPLNLHFELEAGAGGTLIVQPNPSDARVFIDGQERGQGDVTLTNLPLGAEITVRVESKGYRFIEQKVTLTSDARELTMPIRLAREH